LSDIGEFWTNDITVICAVRADTSLSSSLNSLRSDCSDSSPFGLSEEKRLQKVSAFPLQQIEVLNLPLHAVQSL
jgi:hypothetical protein